MNIFVKLWSWLKKKTKQTKSSLLRKCIILPLRHNQQLHDLILLAYWWLGFDSQQEQPLNLNAVSNVYGYVPVHYIKTLISFHGFIVLWSQPLWVKETTPQRLQKHKQWQGKVISVLGFLKKLCRLYSYDTVKSVKQRTSQDKIAKKKKSLFPKSQFSVQCAPRTILEQVIVKWPQNERQMMMTEGEHNENCRVGGWGCKGSTTNLHQLQQLYTSCVWAAVQRTWGQPSQPPPTNPPQSPRAVSTLLPWTPLGKKENKIVQITRGVDKFFKTLARVARSKKCSLAKSENSGSGEEESVKHSPTWQVRFYFYSPKLNSTRIWQVVIRTPG
jgi:hypothetical protein